MTFTIRAAPALGDHGAAPPAGAHRNAPFRSTSRTARHASQSASTNCVAPAPAQFTSMFGPPSALHSSSNTLGEVGQVEAAGLRPPAAFGDLPLVLPFAPSSSECHVTPTSNLFGQCATAVARPDPCSPSPSPPRHPPCAARSPGLQARTGLWAPPDSRSALAGVTASLSSIPPSSRMPRSAARSAARPSLGGAGCCAAFAVVFAVLCGLLMADVWAVVTRLTPLAGLPRLRS